MSDQALSQQTTEAGDPDTAEISKLSRRFASGAVVFEEGDPGHALYLIRSGEVEITRHGAEGQRCLSRLGPGDFFGEQGALIGGLRKIRATAAADAELLELDAELFEEMCLDRPDIGLRFARSMAARTDALEQCLASPAEQGGTHAMLAVLLARSHTVGGTTQVDGTLRVLASEAGLSLSDAHRALQSLFERKLLSLVDDVLHVPQPETLAAAWDPAP